MLMPRLVVRATAFCAALALTFGACGEPGATPAPTATAPEVPAGGNLRIGQAGDIATLDPWNATDAGSLLVTRQLFETLVAHDPASLRIVPRLATRWESSLDGRTWTFTLREGVKFHDGTLLDAAAVAYNFERARDTAHPARGSRGGFALFAARWSVDGGETLVAKVAAPDPRTVVFTLRAAFGPFLADLANPAFAIVSPRSMQSDPEGWMLAASANVAGTGPFRLTPGWWQRDQLVLDRNAAYWQADERGIPLPYLDRLTFRTIADAGARLAELRAGGLDVVRDLPPPELAAVRGSPNLSLLARPPQSVVYLGLSAERPPFDQLDVRRAVAAAVNRQAIAQAAYAGDGRAASQLIPSGVLGHDDSVTEFQRYDEAAAKRLLADAGVARGFETELSYPLPGRADEPDMRKIAEAIAADLARVGIKVHLRGIEPGRIAREREDPRSPLSLGERSAVSADPDELLVAWWDPQARALLQQARVEPGESKRAELYKQVTKMLQQQVPRIPLFHPTRPLAASRKVNGLVPHATGGEPYTRVSLGR